MKEYLTNPNKRCLYCNGREVIDFNEKNEVTETSLVWNDTVKDYMCKDREECRQNVDADNTIISFSGNKHGITKKIVTKYGRLVSEVEAKEGTLEDWSQ